MQIATKSLVLALLCAAYCTSTNARLVDLRGTSWEKHSQKECGLDPYLLYAVALTESKNNAGTKGYVVPSPWALNNYVYGSYYPTSYEDAKRALARYLSVILTRHIQTVFVSTLVLSVGSGIPSARGIPGRCADGFHCNARTLPPGLSTPFSHSVLA